MTAASLIPTEHQAERQLLLELLAERSSALRFGRDVDPQVFKRLVPGALAPLLFPLLRDRSNELAVPPTLLDHFAVHYRGALMIHLKRMALLRSTLRLFAENEIPCLVLKGPVLAHTVYREPATRTMSDLDFGVRPEDRGRAVDMLWNAGFRIPERQLGGSVVEGDTPGFEAPDMKETMVELHSSFDATGSNPTAIRELWDRRRQITLFDDLVVPTLGAEDFFTGVVLHCSKHHRFEEGLRPLLDVALLMRAEAPRFRWSGLREEWKKINVLGWIAVTTRLAHELFDSPLPAALRECEGVEEALPLAAAQLWKVEGERVPPVLVSTLARQKPIPVDESLERHPVALPAGAKGVGIRIRNASLRLRRLGSALANGALRPSNVRAAIRRFEQRERMVRLLDGTPPSDHD